MSLMNKLCDHITKKTIFSNIDLTRYYWQFSMDPKIVQKTAINAGSRDWKFLKMPFGLCNAPTICQQDIGALFFLSLHLLLLTWMILLS